MCGRLTTARPHWKRPLDYQPDVVLLDIGLPGLDGYEVAKRIRQQPTLKNAVLVAMTGYGQEADRAAFAGRGVRSPLGQARRFRQGARNLGSGLHEGNVMVLDHTLTNFIL